MSGGCVFSISLSFNGFAKLEALREAEWMLRISDFRRICESFLRVILMYMKRSNRYTGSAFFTA
jgi:hypothetical protein